VSDAEDKEWEEALRLADENFENYTPTYEINLKSGGAVTIRKRAKRHAPHVGQVHNVRLIKTLGLLLMFLLPSSATTASTIRSRLRTESIS
jgi:hypothetical protein